VLLAVGCGEFVRNNPFDPAVPVTLTLSGPDSAFAQLDTLRFTVATDPAYDFDPPEWTVVNLEPLGEPGTFRVRKADGDATGASYGASVSVRIGQRTVTKLVGVNLKPVSFAVRNCADGSDSVLLESLEQIGMACWTAYDARGLALGSSTFLLPGAVARSLDAAVVLAEGYGQFKAMGNGTTKLVYEWLGTADTLNVTVKQKVAIATPTPPACLVTLGTALAVGDTMRVGIGPTYYDSTSHPILDSATIEAARATPPQWRDVGTGTPHATITPDGLVTAISPGYAYFGSIWQGHCSFVVR
jgi:hypothetical protein